MSTKSINQLLELSNKSIEDYDPESDDRSTELDNYMQNTSAKIKTLLKKSNYTAVIVWSALEAMNDDCCMAMPLSEFEDQFPNLTNSQFTNAVTTLIKNDLTFVEKDDGIVYIYG